MALADLGNAYVNIVPKAEGIKSKLEDIVGANVPNTSGAGKKMGAGVLSGLGGVLSAAAVGKLIKDAFSAGGDLQQSFGGLDTLYAEAAAGAKEYAFAAAQAGISANSYAEQAVSFGAALKKAYDNDVVAAAQAANTAIMDMTDNAAKMGTPIESIQQAYQGFARGQFQLLDNLKLGYGGTKEEMARLLADAQAITGVEYDINNLGDIYSAIHVIQEELGLAGVAAEEAKTTLTGSGNAVKASWTNVLAALTTGEGLETSMQNLSESIGYFSTNILNMLGQLAPQIPVLIMGLLDAIIAAAPSLAAGAAEMGVQLLLGLINSIPSIIGFVPQMFQETVAALTALDWPSIGVSIIEGIIKGLWSAATSLWQALFGIADQAISTTQEALEINSPSKPFVAIGKWLPESVGVGVDKNLASLNLPMERMADAAIGSMRRAVIPGATVRNNNTFDFAQAMAYADERPIEVNVVLQGDAKQVFKVVKSYNSVRTKATSYNALAAKR